MSEPEGVSREELFALLAAKDARIDALPVQVDEYAGGGRGSSNFRTLDACGRALSL